MKWRQVDAHWAVSECGFYTVSRCRAVDGAPLYSAWYRTGAAPSSATNIPPTSLGTSKFPQVAASLCSAHQQQQAQAA
jgi:hypothetical protein